MRLKSHNDHHCGVRPIRTLLLLGLAALLVSASPRVGAAGTPDAAFAEAARMQILDGVKALADPNGPGCLAAYGPGAFTIAWFGAGAADGSAIAAARWGEGRVIALPDHQWLNMGEFGGVADTGRFYRNGIAWLAGGTAEKNVRIVTLDPKSADWLSGQGYTNVTRAGRGNFAAALEGAKVFVAGWLGSSISYADLQAIAAFVKRGGGLFIADYGVGYEWWWGVPISRCPGNRLLREAGIGFAGGNSDWSGPIPVTRAAGRVTAEDVLALLDGKGNYDANQRREAMGMLNCLFDALPPPDHLLATLDAKCTGRMGTLNPTPKTPVSDPFEKALLRREADRLLATPPEQVRAHRTAEAVYGPIPADAPRVTRTVRIDTARPRWHATGLYAVPGEVVTVTVPAAAVGKGIRIRVGSHTDSIARREKWLRVPYGVARAFEVKSATLKVACAFGGALYVDLGEKSGGLEPFDVNFAGAIEAPYFVLGQTTDQEWAAALRGKPAPYAELVGNNLALSLPSSAIRNLENPTAVMQYWDKAVALQDDLCGDPAQRNFAERFDLDVQISAGYLHSGYPIMGPVSTAAELVSLERLTSEGNWGYFHELGHNHQKPWWTFAGDTEVTENIFSNYCMEMLAPHAKKEGWAWSVDPAKVAARAEAEAKKGGTYTSKPNRWAFWYRLADDHGWEAYRKVFRDYLAGPRASLPRSEQEKKDQWLIRFSQAAGHNLTRTMRDGWGLEVSAGAVAAVKGLPE